MSHRTGRIRVDESAIRWFLPRLVAVIVAVGLPFGAYTMVGRLTHSALFMVERVDVVGNDRVPEDEVLRAAGLGRARNILTVDAAEIRDGVEAHPWVRSAEVRIDLRVRSVVVQIEERELAGIGLRSDAMLIDRNGEAIRPWRAADGLSVPVLLSNVPPGEDPTPTFRELLRVAELAAATGVAESNPVVEVHEIHRQGYRVVFADGFELSLGRSDVATRVSRLDEALAVVSARGRRPTYAVSRGSDPYRIVVGSDQMVASAEPAAQPSPEPAP